MVFETKFEKEEEVFFMHQNKVCSARITAIVINLDRTLQVSYRCKNELFDEKNLFKTKEELLASL